MAKRKRKLSCAIREAKKIYSKTKGSKSKWKKALRAGAKRCKGRKK